MVSYFQIELAHHAFLHFLKGYIGHDSVAKLRTSQLCQLYQLCFDQTTIHSHYWHGMKIKTFILKQTGLKGKNICQETFNTCTIYYDYIKYEKFIAFLCGTGLNFAIRSIDHRSQEGSMKQHAASNFCESEPTRYNVSATLAVKLSSKAKTKKSLKTTLMKCFQFHAGKGETVI